MVVENNYEKKINRIHEIISNLENDDLTLEDNISLVEEGLKLSRECKNYLDKIELKVEKILNKRKEKFE